MNTEVFIASCRKARAAQNEAKRRRTLYLELGKLFSGGALVFAGLLLATLYGLLTHQIHR